MVVPSRVFLIGPMGAGKSTIGRHLASRLRLSFVDSDTEIEERTGADIAWIFDVEGEEGFRNREEAVIAELTQRDGIVLATGGGAVLRPANRQALASRGFVIYLQVSIEQQLSRVASDKRRPLLRDNDPEQVLRRIALERESLYQELADLVIETDGKGPKAVALQLARELAP
jgi:shikimate kinase